MIASVADSKAVLRARIRASRAAGLSMEWSAATRAGLLDTARAAGLLDPDGTPGSTGRVALAAYVAAPGEPDVAAIRAAIREAGGLVVLPIPGPERALGWALDEGTYSAHPRLPVEMPIGEALGIGAAPLLSHHVGTVLVPALAVDGTGLRLGQGGGYYDRLLAELAEVAGRMRTVAIVHDEELLPEGAVPREAHDQAVTAVLTPTRYVRFAG